MEKNPGKIGIEKNQKNRKKSGKPGKIGIEKVQKNWKNPEKMGKNSKNWEKSESKKSGKN